MSSINGSVPLTSDNRMNLGVSEILGELASISYTYSLSSHLHAQVYPITFPSNEEDPWKSTEITGAEKFASYFCVTVNAKVLRGIS